MRSPPASCGSTGRGTRNRPGQRSKGLGASRAAGPSSRFVGAAQQGRRAILKPGTAPRRARARAQQQRDLGAWMAWLLRQKAISQRRLGAHQQQGLESAVSLPIGTTPAAHLNPRQGAGARPAWKRREGLFPSLAGSTAQVLGVARAQARTRRRRWGGASWQGPGPWRSQISCQQRSGPGAAAAAAIGEGRRGLRT